MKEASRALLPSPDRARVRPGELVGGRLKCSAERRLLLQEMATAQT